MLPLVEFPQIVQHYAAWFETVFSAEALVQFQRYLSGLILSENKTVESINRLFVIESRHQSSLNRLLTASPLSEAVLNQQRLVINFSQPDLSVSPRFPGQGSLPRRGQGGRVAALAETRRFLLARPLRVAGMGAVRLAPKTRP